jgi:aspartate carbamoyltransferase catalytic subunit
MQPGYDGRQKQKTDPAQTARLSQDYGRTPECNLGEKKPFPALPLAFPVLPEMKRFDFPHTHIIDSHQFSREDLNTILAATEHIVKLKEQNRLFGILDGRLMASLFFESSTRTRLSFEAAMHRLGGRIITTVGFQFSSISKGETLHDTMKMIEAYADIAVIRHPVEGSSRIAAACVKIPIINAGDGAGQHPTQALLDLYTIIRERGLPDKKRIAFIGDLKFGRTIHSLVKLLTHYETEFVFISPVDLALPESYRKELRSLGHSFEETDDLKAMWDCDVAYITRIQEERFTDRAEYERLKDSYVVNRAFVQASRRRTLIMHPLPRVNELSTDVDELPDAAYFRQAAYGVDVRMALLCLLLRTDLPEI